MTHLILHKVRGEPAFDIAEKIQIGDEEGWIIPTSGHRAYPYQTWPLTQLWSDREYVPVAVEPPEFWPDHYETKGSPPPKDFNIMKVIGGLFPKLKDRRF